MGGQKRVRGAIRHELKKLRFSKTFGISLIIGACIVFAHFASVCAYVNRVYYSYVGISEHPMGLDSISLLALILPNDNWFMTAFLFYLLLPILAAFPFGASFHEERKSGYQRHILTRISKKQYLSAKILVCALSGFLTIFILLVLDMMMCAIVCPLTRINVLSLVSGVWEGSFASSLFYNHPLLYIGAVILMTSSWGAVCSVLALASGMYFTNPFFITSFPCFLILILTTVMEFLKGTVFRTFYEVRPLFLMKAEPGNFNPAWYIFMWQCGFIFPAIAVYYWKGMRHENL